MLGFYLRLSVLLLVLFVQACGQIGPLYLPDAPPPVHVPKDDK